MGRGKIPERFNWAIEIIQPKPADKILEIGCGTGLLAEQIASRLTRGEITAVDRSGAMLDKARKRNEVYAKHNKIRFIHANFSAFQSVARYDKIVAFNVNFFWKGVGKELDILTQSLLPRGLVYAFFEAPFNRDVNGMAELISTQLVDHSFKIIDQRSRNTTPVPSFCIIAKPAGSK